MKNHFALILLLMSGLYSQTQAQISILPADVANAGDKVIYKTANYSGSFGSAGAAQIWNFADLDGIGNDTVKYLLPSQTPAGQSFSGVNLAFEEAGQYVYANKAQNGLFLRGIVLGAAFDSVPFLPSGPIKFALSPQLAVLPFPANYNNISVSSAASDFTFPYDTIVSVGGNDIDIDSVRIILNLEVTDSLNGYGTILMPDNISFEGLRQVLIQDYSFGVEVFTRIQLPFGGSLPLWIALPVDLPTTRNNTCRYWAKGKKAPVVEFNLDSAGTNIVSTRYQSTESLTSIKNRRDTFSFSLYPNPATKEISINGVKATKVEIVSLLGQTLKVTDINHANSQTTVDISNLKTGTYICRVTNDKGEKVHSRFMVTR